MNIRFKPVLGMLALLGAGAILGGKCEIEVDDDGEIEIDRDDRAISENGLNGFPTPAIFQTA